MKKVLVVILVLIMATSLAACSAKKPEEKPQKINLDELKPLPKQATGKKHLHQKKYWNFAKPLPTIVTDVSSLIPRHLKQNLTLQSLT